SSRTIGMRFRAAPSSCMAAAAVRSRSLIAVRAAVHSPLLTTGGRAGVTRPLFPGAPGSKRRRRLEREGKPLAAATKPCATEPSRCRSRRAKPGATHDVMALVAGHARALRAIPVGVGLVAAAVGDARDSLDAEVGVVQRDVPGHGRPRVVDVDAIVARSDDEVSLDERVGGRRLYDHAVEIGVADEVSADRVAGRRRPALGLERGDTDASQMEVTHLVAFDEVAGSAFERDAEAAFAVTAGAGELVVTDDVPVPG